MKIEMNCANKAPMSTENRKRLHTLVGILLLCPIFSIALIVFGIMDIYDPNFCGYYWLSYTQIVVSATVLVLTIIMIYQCVHCHGNYRCKECGHIHAPDDEALVEMLVDEKKTNHLPCPMCGARTRHARVSRSRYQQVITK